MNTQPSIDQIRSGHRSLRRRCVVSVALALAVAASVATGCSNSGSSAPGTTPTSSGPSSSSAEGALSDDDWQVAMARCLREAGYDVEDPKSGEGIVVPGEADMDAVAAAMNTCQAEIGGPSEPSDPNADATGMEDQEQTLALAACLRREGYDVADPKAGQPLLLPVDIPADVYSECREEAQG
jgi:hypothetical protein